jgi:hypothetical protein
MSQELIGNVTQIILKYIIDVKELIIKNQLKII